jgi:predicted TIM-barrel fold metal-dependent hydrolase
LRAACGALGGPLRRAFSASSVTRNTSRVSDEDKTKIYQTNAERVFNLSAD